MDAQKLNHYQQ